MHIFFVLNTILQNYVHITISRKKNHKNMCNSEISWYWLNIRFGPLSDTEQF